MAIFTACLSGPRPAHVDGGLALRDRIHKDGVAVSDTILKVDSFLNHCVDPVLIDAVGAEFARRFLSLNVTRVITIESGGNCPAFCTALHLGVPMVYGKKSASATIDKAASYSVEVFSYTKKVTSVIMVRKDFIQPGDRVLIIDDFLATGAAVVGLLDIISQAQASCVGIGICVEKSFQNGRVEIGAAWKGPIESLARVKALNPEKGVEFIED